MFIRYFYVYLDDLEYLVDLENVCFFIPEFKIIYDWDKAWVDHNISKTCIHRVLYDFLYFVITMVKCII